MLVPTEQLEVVSLPGNTVVTDDCEHKLHARVVVGKNDGTAYAGHLLKAYVWPALEVILIEPPEYLRRSLSRGSGVSWIQRFQSQRLTECARHHGYQDQAWNKFLQSSLKAIRISDISGVGPP